MADPFTKFSWPNVTYSANTGPIDSFQTACCWAFSLPRTCFSERWYQLSGPPTDIRQGLRVQGSHGIVLRPSIEVQESERGSRAELLFAPPGARPRPISDTVLTPWGHFFSSFSRHLIGMPAYSYSILPTCQPCNVPIHWDLVGSRATRWSNKLSLQAQEWPASSRGNRNRRGQFIHTRGELGARWILVVRSSKPAIQCCLRGGRAAPNLFFTSEL